jgi:hypothetical protein
MLTKTSMGLIPHTSFDSQMKKHHLIKESPTTYGFCKETPADHRYLSNLDCSRHMNWQKNPLQKEEH